MTPIPGPKIVYGLVDPRDGTVRYVGASAAPGKRYEEHLAWTRNIGRDNPWPEGSSRRQSHDERWGHVLWLQELDAEGLKPDLRLLSDPVDDWRKAEKQAQRKYGATLLNPNDRAPYYQREDVGALVGQHLASARESVGLTQSGAAALLDTSQATISRWENGDRSPSLRQLYRIGAAYGVPTATLIPELMPSSEGATTDATKARRRK